MFGRTVRARRTRLGWSQEDLALRAGVDVKTIGNLEADRTRPRPSTVRLVIEALKVDDRDRATFYANAAEAAAAKPHAHGHRTVRVDVLGPVGVTAADGSAIAVGGRQHQMVLAVLAAAGGRRVDDAALVQAVWGQQAEVPSPVGLRVLVHGLRRALGSEAIRRVGRGYQLVCDMDAYEFEESVRLADALTGPSARDACRAALALWRGPAFAGLGAGAPVRAEADRLDGLRLRCYERCLELELDLGDNPDLAGELANLAAAHPLHEPLQALLMQALVRADRRAEALTVYERVRRRLADELGVDPGDRLRELHTEILRGPPGAVLQRPAQLPPDPSHFHARAAELTALDAVCGETPNAQRPAALAVVSGIGGIGKTALVSYWSHRRTVRFGDGQLYLDLDAHPEPGSALGRALLDLGVAPDELPGPPADRSARLRSILATRSLLVVLDNVISAAQARPFLPGSYTSSLVVISRNRLDGLVARDGAALIALGPLPPDASLALLRAIGGLPAGAHDDELRILADLCDGLPLALRIVGAHLRLGSEPADLVEELRSEATRVERLCTADGDAAVHPTIAVSYRRLAEPARQMLRWLGRTTGTPIPVPALAALAGVRLAPARAAVEALARVNLVQLVGRGRVAVHQLVRIFAHEQIGEDEAAHQRGDQRLLTWYAHAVDRADRRLRPSAARIPGALPGQAPTGMPTLSDVAAAVEFLDTEADTLASLIGRYGTVHPDLVWPIVASLRGWLQRRAPRDTWITLAQQGAAAAAAAEALAGQAALHASLGVAHSLLLDRTSAQAAYQRAIDLYGAAGDVAGQVDTYASLGGMLTDSGSLDRALHALAQAQSLGAGLDDPDLTFKVELNLGFLHRRAGRLGSALHAYESAMAAAQRSTNRQWLSASVHTNLGRLRFVRGEQDQAEYHYRQAVELARNTADRMREAWALHGVSDVLAARGDHDGAVAAMREAIGLLEPLGDRRLPEMRVILADLEHRAGSA